METNARALKTFSFCVSCRQNDLCLEGLRKKRSPPPKKVWFEWTTARCFLCSSHHRRFLNNFATGQKYTDIYIFRVCVACENVAFLLLAFKQTGYVVFFCSSLFSQGHTGSGRDQTFGNLTPVFGFFFFFAK